MEQETSKGNEIMGLNRSKTLLAITLCLCMLLASTLITNAGRNGAPESYVYSIDSYGIHRMDVNAGSERVIFDTKGMYGVSFSLSPSDIIIAVLITERGVTPPGAHVYSVLPKNSMVFIDTEGNEIATLDDDVRQLSWNPDGDRLAYITGTYSEDGDIGFKATGLYTFDLRNGNKTRIADKASQVNWAVFDSCIYYKHRRTIYKYDPVTRITETTSYHGLHFSPDGKYYLAISSMEYPRLFISATNEELTERVQQQLTYVPRSWIPEKKHHLMATVTEYEPVPGDTISHGRPRAMVRVERPVKQKTCRIYDVESDKVIKEWIVIPDR